MIISGWIMSIVSEMKEALMNVTAVVQAYITVVLVRPFISNVEILRELFGIGPRTLSCILSEKTAGNRSDDAPKEASRARSALFARYELVKDA